MNNATAKFYNKGWFIWFMLLLFAPLGLILLWKNKKYSRTTRLILTSIFSVWFLFLQIPSSDKNTIDRDSTINEPSENIPANPGNTPENVQQNANILPTQMPTSSSTDKVSFEAVKVVRIVDGDTIEVRLQSGAIEKVRLIGIDTPESTTSQERYGKEASEFTNNSLSEETIYIEKDVSERDRYGRLLRVVWLEKPSEINESNIRGKMFNAILVLKGFAQVSTYPPDVKYSEYFTKYAKEAREAGAGFWSLDTTINSPSPQTVLKPSPQKTPASNKINEKIKGNMSSSGEKIYHVPGGVYYERTIAEEYFDTEEEARAAGYRRSKR